MRIILLLLISLCVNVYAVEIPDSLNSVTAIASDTIISSPLTARYDSLPPANMSQRKITPVDVDDRRPRQPILHYYDKHGNPLNEPVLFLADLDTTTTLPTSKSIYPRVNGISFGLNIWDVVMQIAGQKHCSFDVWADMSIHNWFFPIVEFGVGFASNTPENGNFTYEGKSSVFAKIGMNYNFLYKSDPDYQVFLGLRAAASSFRYDIDNIMISVPYWNENEIFSITGQHASALWGEVLLGIKVKIYSHFSMGWTFRYKFMFKCTDGSNSSPWFIPGYGTRNNAMGATFSLIYTLPIRKKALGTVEL